MINDYQVKKFCCEDISLIENYNKAIANSEQTWHCHHRNETDFGLSMNKLKAMGLYWNRPANELIFLTESEHKSLHAKNMTSEHKTKLSKPKSPEFKTNLSKVRKGKYVGETSPRSIAVYQIDKTTGAIIKEWKCISDATRTLGIHQSAIIACCKKRPNRRTAGGYVWKYAV